MTLLFSLNATLLPSRFGLWLLCSLEAASLMKCVGLSLFGLASGQALLVALSGGGGSFVVSLSLLRGQVLAPASSSLRGTALYLATVHP